MKILSKSIIETEKIAKNFLETLSKNKKATIIGLYGDLGSGKTAFVKGIAKALNLEKTVSSPTFVIEKIYKLHTDYQSDIESKLGEQNNEVYKFQFTKLRVKNAFCHKEGKWEFKQNGIYGLIGPNRSGKSSIPG